MLERTHLVGVWSLLAALGSEGAAPSPPPAVVAVRKPACHAGIAAEVEIHREGRVRRGRVVLLACGQVHVEHLDAEQAGWCRRLLEGVTADGPCLGRGWDDRLGRGDGKLRYEWGTVGDVRVLHEVHVTTLTGVHRVRLLHHRLLGRGTR